MTDRIDWRVPIHAQAEETYWTDVSDDGSDQPRRSIRWLLSAEGYGRVHRGEACWDCLSGFPAPLGRAHLQDWHNSEFRYPFSWARARKLIREFRCPCCGAECTAEMLAIQTDEAWQKADDRLYQGSRLALEDVRERETWAEQFLPREEIAPPAWRQSMKRKGES